MSTLVLAIWIDNSPSQIKDAALRDAALKIEDMDDMLADIYNGNIDNISLLSGADYYFQIVKEHL